MLCLLTGDGGCTIVGINSNETKKYLGFVKKKVIDIVPSRDVTYQTIPGRE
jgi:hypothetical protein